MSRITLLLGALAMTVLAAFAGAGTASAAADGRSAFVAQAREAGLSAGKAAGLQAKVDAYLTELAGTGTQVSPNQIDLNGAMLNVAVPGEKQPRQLGETGTAAEGPNAAECVSGARYGWFCAYKYQGFTGDNIGMYSCGWARTIPWFTVGSWDNNQTAGTRPLLTFTNGSTWSMPGARSSQTTGVDWAPVRNIQPC
ncbi:hypothetical protein AB0M97_25925 [Streptomyces sp. NPDC051207]|uniref:hypothetical protein n=1 Tax=Streptomyces sp. NPDC051207 TaxID=3154641 RepID=UPI003434BB6F